MSNHEARRWRASRRSRGPIELVRAFLANALSVRLLRLAHQRAAPIRLTLGVLVGALWLGFGAAAAIDQARLRVEQNATPLHAEPSPALVAFSEGLCFLQSGKECDFDKDARDWRLRVSQTSLSVLTILTLLFGFWTQLLGAIARAMRALGAGHVIIIGDGAEPDQLARDVARRHRPGRKAAVLLRKNAAQADIDALAADGVAVMTGPLNDPALLRAAGVNSADRIVVISNSDSDNVAAAAAARRNRRTARAGDVLVRLEDPRLRRDLTRHGRLRSADVFSLADVAARQTFRSTLILEEAERRGHERIHIALIGWDETAAALAAQTLRLMWLPGFAAPRVSVFAADAEEGARHFRARYPQAFVNPFWQADIAFQTYDWDDHADPWAPLDACERARGPFTAAIVSWPHADDTLRCAAVLAAEAGETQRPLMLVREGEGSVVSLALESTPFVTVVPFGAPETLLSAQALVDRTLDASAKIVHNAYIETIALNQHRDAYKAALLRGAGLRDGFRLRFAKAPDNDDIDTLEHRYIDLFGQRAWWRLRERATQRILDRGMFTPAPDRPAQKPWDDLAEHYINGNRAGADHALMKLWRLGYRPARAGERGAIVPIAPADVTANMSETEHRRWAAELMLAGWRRGERNDAQLTHPDLRDYAEFPAAELEMAIIKDRDPWLVAARIGAATSPKGFTRREPSRPA